MLLCRSTITAIQNVTGALLTASIFLGTSNASTVQPVLDTERTVFYRYAYRHLFFAICDLVWSQVAA